MNATEKLESMIGETFMYRTMTIKIKGTIINGSFIIVKTNVKDLTFPNEKGIKPNIEDFIQECLPLSSEVEERGLSTLQKEIKPVADLQAILLNNIEKVQQDKDYIGQASAVNEMAKTLIDITKVRISIAKNLLK
jgi:hypothetical protein